MFDPKEKPESKIFAPSRVQKEEPDVRSFDGETAKPIRRSVIFETTRNIDSIAKAIDEGRPADKELMVNLINRMLAFLDATIKQPGTKPCIMRDNTKCSRYTTTDKCVYLSDSGCINKEGPAKCS